MNKGGDRPTRKLSPGVYYTSYNGGMYVRWNGRPEGSVYTTYSEAVAYDEVDVHGLDEDGYSWQGTPFQGADGSCRLARILQLAAEYTK